MHTSRDSIFWPIHPGGEHIVTRRVTLERLMDEVMPSIEKVESVNLSLHETESMTGLVDSLTWYAKEAPIADNEKSCTEVCCDITSAWEALHQPGMPRVRVGVSAQGGTLYVVFVRSHVRNCTIEAFCQY
jgi:hypothetical protein